MNWLPKKGGNLLCLPILCLIIASTLHAEPTWVPQGNVSGTWTIDGSPYLIYEGPITIQNSLVIDAGVSVFVLDTFSIRVNGVLTVNGTATDSVFFGVPDTSAQNVHWRGIRFQEASGSLSYAVFEGGAAYGQANERYGGAIACSLSTVNIHNCTFRNNSAQLSGGAIYAHDVSFIHAEDCLITDNFSEFDGGGIMIRAASELELIRCTVRNNYTPFKGGGIGCEDHSILNIEHCTIDSNFSGVRGGGLWIECQEQSFISGSILRSNQARYGAGFFAQLPTLHINGCLLLDNEAFARGGAGYASSCRLNIANSVIAGSYPHGLYLESNQSTTVNYNCFIDNDAADIEGSVNSNFGVIDAVNFLNIPCDSLSNIFVDPGFVDQAAGDYHLTDDSPCICGGRYGGLDSDFAGRLRPSPPGSPPDIGIFESELHLPYTFLCGSLRGTIEADTYLVGCDIDIEENESLLIEPGSCLRFLGPYSINVEGQLFAPGTASDTIRFVRHMPFDSMKWRGVRFDHGAGQLDFCELSNSGLASGNTSEVNATVWDNQGDVGIAHCYFHDNHTTQVTCLSANITVQNCLFENNSSFPSFYGFGANGSAIENCTFINDLRYIQNVVWNSSGIVSMRECEFSGQQGIYGIGIRIYGDSEVHLTNCDFIGKYNWDGLVLITGQSAAYLDRCSFTAFDSYSSARALYCRDESEVTLVECHIHDMQNSVQCYDHTVLNCINSVIENNKYSAVIAQNQAEVNMTSSIFSGNTGSAGGALIFYHQSGGQFTNCQFLDNSATNWGGAISMIDTTSCHFNKCLWSGNFIEGNGVGGAVSITGGEHTFERCRFFDNHALVGGALSVKFSDTRVTNCTFSQNAGTHGAGIALDRTYAEIKNTIVAYSFGQGLYFYGNAHSSDVRYNDFFGNSGGDVRFNYENPEYAPDSIFIMTAVNIHGDPCDRYHNISVNPSFADTAAGDLRLTNLSHCINAGDPASQFDPDNSICDQGYDPYVQPTYQLQPFSLLSPADSTTVSEESTEFTWQHCIDPNTTDHVPNYFLQIAYDAEYDDIFAENLLPDSFIVLDLPDDTVFFWHVMAIGDAEQVRWSTEEWSLRTSYPDPPSPPELVSPQNGDTLERDMLSEFCWTRSIDPDIEDTVSYRLRLSDGDTLITIDGIDDTCTTLIVNNYGLNDSLEIQWWIEAVSQHPDTAVASFTHWSFWIEAPAALQLPEFNIPSVVALYPNYPNPFNAETLIKYDIPKASHVRLRVLNILGQEVSALVNAQQAAGRYSIHWSATDLPSGVYFLWLEAEQEIQLQKAFLLR